MIAMLGVARQVEYTRASDATQWRHIPTSIHALTWQRSKLQWSPAKNAAMAGENTEPIQIHGRG